jgi:two-component system, chemotaxis family, response regulator Rcp1
MSATSLTEQVPSALGRPARILLVEDSDGDAKLTALALQRARVANVLDRVADGEEALEFLQQRGRHPDAQRPDLVLLDLNLPRLSGAEVLQQVKTDPQLRRIPVVVLTTSAAEDDVRRAYDAYASGYITKPVEFPKLIDALASLEQFWFTVVQLPHQGP